MKPQIMLTARQGNWSAAASVSALFASRNVSSPYSYEYTAPHVLLAAIYGHIWPCIYQQVDRHLDSEIAVVD